MLEEMCHGDRLSGFTTSSLLPFFFSLSTSSIQRKMWSVRFLLLQLGLPLPSVSFFGHGIKTIPSQGLQRKKECYYDLDLK